MPPAGAQAPAGAGWLGDFADALAHFAGIAASGVAYLRTSPTPAEFSNRTIQLTAASIEIAGARPERRYLLLLNTSAANSITVNFGSAAQSGQGLLLPAGGYYEPLVPPANAIFALSGAGAGLLIIEG